MYRKISLGLKLILALTLLLVIPTNSASAQSSTTQYLIVSARSGKCLEVEGGSTAPHASVIQATCSGGLAQRWYILTEDTTNATPKGRIRNAKSSLCLDITAGSTADGAKLQQFTCNIANMNQRVTRYRIQQSQLEGDALMHLRMQHSLKCLDVPSNNLAGGVQIQQFSCHHKVNQMWLIIPAFGGGVLTPAAEGNPALETPLAEQSAESSTPDTADLTNHIYLPRLRGK